MDNLYTLLPTRAYLQFINKVRYPHKCGYVYKHHKKPVKKINPFPKQKIMTEKAAAELYIQ